MIAALSRLLTRKRRGRAGCHGGRLVVAEDHYPAGTRQRGRGCPLAAGSQPLHLAHLASASCLVLGAARSGRGWYLTRSTSRPPPASWSRPEPSVPTRLRGHSPARFGGRRRPRWPGVARDRAPSDDLYSGTAGVLSAAPKPRGGYARCNEGGAPPAGTAVARQGPGRGHDARRRRALWLGWSRGGAARLVGRDRGPAAAEARRR